jgi:hypothetical protein
VNGKVSSVDEIRGGAGHLPFIHSEEGEKR